MREDPRVVVQNRKNRKSQKSPRETGVKLGDERNIATKEVTKVNVKE